MALPDRATFLAEFARLARTDWPANRTLNVVCHGHSVPAGYFDTPAVHTLESYPHLLHRGLCERYPHAVINVIVTAIGGENCERGERRFASEVMAHRPDVLTIDYALNDRGLGFERTRAAWASMIEQAQEREVPVILLTPTPDLRASLHDPTDELLQHAAFTRELAAEFGTGLVDSIAHYQRAVAEGASLESLMSHVNHPSAAGHALVAEALLEWFP